MTPDMKSAAKASEVYGSVINKLCVAVDELDLRLPNSYRHAQFAEAHAQLNELISLFEDLQYEAGMDYESLVEAEAEERERADYERLKAKFGA